MYETANAALDSARELGLPADVFRQVGPKQWRRVLASIFQAFANTHRTDVTWLWRELKHHGVAMQMSNALAHLSTLVAPKTSVWLLLEDGYRKKRHGNYWVFEGTFSAVLSVLNNMPYIEYYIVGREFDWMILENHHDVVVGIGEPAESFVAAYRARLSNGAI